MQLLAELRSEAPVVKSQEHGWMVLGHAEVMELLLDHETFSNQVSSHLSIPNGMDPPQHTHFRSLIDSFFTPVAMAEFKPRCQEIVQELVASLPRDEDIEAVTKVGEELALRVQTAFMGWPARIEESLRAWTHANLEATRSRDQEAAAQVAQSFSDQVREIILDDGRSPVDAISSLISAKVDGRSLAEEEIVSIVRNWTMGEVGTITSSVGIIVDHLARDADLQSDLRSHPDDLGMAVDEILRIQGPLMTNRRVATRRVELAGQVINKGDRLTIMWPQANRDESVFGDADAFRPEANASMNLLYGGGIHICPGAPLARMQLTMITRELLQQSSSIEPGKDPSQRAVFPSGGFAAVWVRLR